MTLARQDYEGFVQWLYQHDHHIPSDVRRLALLSLANFDMLARTSRNRSQRSSYLATLMRSELAQIEDTAPNHVAERNVYEWPWTHLSDFMLGPFRGFRQPEQFDLTKPIILFYGPNGSGKTSLCEGLEYALLGDVEEASAKRISSEAYLTNIHSENFDTPVLRAVDHQGNAVEVASDPDLYRFCFIEKNRIDAFSRIAARPNAQRAELIATLFGMEKFNDFVSQFNESIDSQLVLHSEKQKELVTQRERLAEDQRIVDQEIDAFEQLAAEEAALALEYAPETTFEGLKQLIGTSESPGRLQELDGIVEAVPPPIVGVTREALQAVFTTIRDCEKEETDLKSTLQNKSDQVSYQSLYLAVLELRQTVGQRCPACDTPLEGTSKALANPYDKATEGLRQLGELGKLQEDHETAKRKANQASRELRDMLAVVTQFILAQNEHDSPIGQYLLALPQEPEKQWWRDLYKGAVQLDGVSFEDLLRVSDRIEALDAISSQAQLERQRHIEERRRLSEFQLRLQSLNSKRQQLRDRVESAKERVRTFNEANAVLIRQAREEQSNIEQDTRLKAAYDQFLEELRIYRNQLPGHLMAGLNETALELYNSFNRNDRDEDKLSSLSLPITGEEKIEIAFRGNHERNVDALHVLSEGHIRCLGLAILLAKAKNIACPLIIFDDAINAIDHDHRGGIRETIFESDHFSETQLIVTCHSNEFIKDIQQNLPPHRRQKCRVYLLRHHNGDYQPRVLGNIPSANYIEKARRAREMLDDREALTASRKALEMLSERIWRWLGSHDQGLLSLKLPGVGAEPSLRNLCEAIAKKLRDANTFDHPTKIPVSEGLDRILGIPNTNLIWTYLNKGTHEEADRDDFDSEKVDSLVQTLEELDQLDLRSGR